MRNIELPKHSMQFGPTDTEREIQIENKGYVTDVMFKLPNFANNVNGTISICDEDGDNLYDSGPRAKGEAHVLANINVPAAFNFKVKCTLSGAPGGVGGTVKVRLAIDC